jgi:hypothetical protein
MGKSKVIVEQFESHTHSVRTKTSRTSKRYAMPQQRMRLSEEGIGFGAGCFHEIKKSEHAFIMVK